MAYEINPDRVVYETEIFVVDAGPFPGEDLDCYRCWNKNTQVLEYAHSILFYAQQWALNATKVLKDGVEMVESDLPEV